MESLEKLRQTIIRCNRCPRLRTHCQTVAREKKREFRDWTYWGKPIAGFGDPQAKLWIVGLAPAAHGANRTGRMFTGDSSGLWLYRALHAVGFANQPNSDSIDDGLMLNGVYISAAARCAPPDNKPTLEELHSCESYLDAEFALLKKRKLILALGSIALTAVLKMWERNTGEKARPRPRFGHNLLYTLGSERILCSFHPSRQNTNTKRLTPAMWNTVFERARELVGN